MSSNKKGKEKKEYILSARLVDGKVEYYKIPMKKWRKMLKEIMDENKVLFEILEKL